MFLLIEGDRLINLTLISRIELYHAGHQKYARLYNGAVMEGDSKIAYDYFTNPGNAGFLMVPVAAAVEA